MLTQVREVDTNKAYVCSEAGCLKTINGVTSDGKYEKCLVGTTNYCFECEDCDAGTGKG